MSESVGKKKRVLRVVLFEKVSKKPMPFLDPKRPAILGHSKKFVEKKPKNKKDDVPAPISSTQTVLRWQHHDNEEKSTRYLDDAGERWEPHHGRRETVFETTMAMKMEDGHGDGFLVSGVNSNSTKVCCGNHTSEITKIWKIGYILHVYIYIFIHPLYKVYMGLIIKGPPPLRRLEECHLWVQISDRYEDYKVFVYNNIPRTFQHTRRAHPRQSP